LVARKRDQLIGTHQQPHRLAPWGGNRGAAVAGLVRRCRLVCIRMFAGSTTPTTAAWFACLARVAADPATTPGRTGAYPRGVPPTDRFARKCSTKPLHTLKGERFIPDIGADEVSLSRIVRGRISLGAGGWNGGGAPRRRKWQFGGLLWPWQELRAFARSGRFRRSADVWPHSRHPRSRPIWRNVAGQDWPATVRLTPFASEFRLLHSDSLQYTADSR